MTHRISAPALSLVSGLLVGPAFADPAPNQNSPVPALLRELARYQDANKTNHDRRLTLDK